MGRWEQSRYVCSQQYVPANGHKVSAYRSTTGKWDMLDATRRENTTGVAGAGLANFSSTRRTRRGSWKAGSAVTRYTAVTRRALDHERLSATGFDRLATWPHSRYATAIFLRKYDEEPICGSSGIICADIAGSSSGSTTLIRSVYQFYPLQPDSRSVPLNIIAGANLELGVPTVTSNPTAAWGHEKVAAYFLELTSETIVQLFLDFTVADRLDKYKYDTLGSGCRWHRRRRQLA